MFRKTTAAFALIVCVLQAPSLLAQTANAPSKAPVKTPAPAEKPAAKKPGVDIDSFFEQAEQQTRRAQERGNPNCVPKPAAEKSVKPVA